MIRYLSFRTLCTALVLSMAPGAVLATTFNILYSSPHAPLAVWNRMAKEFYFVEVNKRLQPLGHRINWTDSYGGTIVKFGSEVDSLQKGLADMSMVGAIFNQSRLPLHLASYAAPFATTNLKLAVETMDEVTANNAALKKMWDDAGLVHLASIGIEALHLYTKKPIAGMQDLKGMKIGGVGINMAWLRNSGVVPVVNTPDKVYNDIQTGVIEGQLYLPTLTFVGKVNEVAPYMLNVGFGVAVWGSLAVAKKTWDTFPPDVQKVMREVAIEYRVKTVEGLDALAATGIETMKKAGMKVTEISAADRQAWANALPDLPQEWIQPLEAKGLPAKQVFNEYLAGLRKRGEKPLRNWEAK
jgi:TRAP-type C4-dicarboxylate transport system substrate-binding protein